MNCEQVKELLSAYLDNMLPSDERRLVASHLQSCSACSQILADYSYYDTLIALLPRVSPDVALREQLFASPDLFDSIDNDPLSGEAQQEWTQPPITRLPAKHPRRDTPGRPQLIAIPGGRSARNTDDVRSSDNTRPTPSARISQQATQPRQQTSRAPRRSGRGLRVMIATLAAALVLSLGIGAFLGFTILSRGLQAAGPQGITPPSGFQGGSPLSAGARYVFLRGNSLWSELANGSEKQPDLLTPPTVSVAPDWVVSNPLPGRSAGDRLAYIDLTGAKVHTIRSDGLQDTTVSQPLLKAGINPASTWDTATGGAILASLAWSSDGNNLAFLADPTGSGRTSLYIYSTVTGKVTAVPSPIQGSISHASWSPDGARLAFEVTQNGLTSIIDYNVSNHGVLVIAENIGAGDGVLAMDWSPNLQTPAITWSVGVIGHVHSLWTRIVDGYGGAVLLLSGDYAQAIYSRNGDNATGSWLVITSNAGLAGDIWRIDVTPGSRFVRLTANRQANFAQWSPDGSSIDYLDSLSAGIGTLYVVNATTAVDRLVASGATNEPAPVWSADNQQIAFSTGSRVGIASVLAGSSIHYLTLKGAASDLTWSLTSPHQLIVAMNDGQPGIFLEDTQHNTSQLLDPQGTDGPLLWTQIP